MLNLVILSHGYLPRIGGIEALLGQVAPRLAQRGVRTMIVARGEPGAPRRECHDGVEVIRVPNIGSRLRVGHGRATGPLRVGARIVDSLVYTVTATVLLLSRRPDVIHTHELLSTARAGLIGGRLLGVPVIVTSHRSGPIGDVGRLRTTWRGRRRLRWMVTNADLAMSVSREIDDEFAALAVPPDRRTVIGNGVDIDRFRPTHPGERGSVRSQYGLGDGPVVIFVGRLAPEKRAASLLEVWPRVTAVEPLAQLLLVGTGPEEERLRGRAPASVHFVGMQSDVVGFLRLADVFVLPSIAEGWSVSLVEAQACGLPAVVTDVGAAREVVEDEVTGFVVPPEDPEALAEALLRMVCDQHLRAVMGRASRDRAIARFSIDRTIESLIGAYDQVVRRRACLVR